MHIADLSAASVETGAFPIDVYLSDGELTYMQTLSLNIGGLDGDSTIEETAVVVTEEVTETTVDPEPESTVEEGEVSTASFDWEAAFERLFELRERKKQEEGEAYVEPPVPTASMGSITANGAFSINFSEEIEVVPDMKLIKEGEIIDGLGIKRPVIEVEVIPGESSEESKIGFSWDIVGMTTTSMEF